MSLDLLHQWLLFRPLIVFLVVCPLVALAALVRWYTERRHAKRIRDEEADRVLTVIAAADDGSDQVAACEELIRRYAHVMPREWDGGQPRPNLNRRSG